MKSFEVVKSAAGFCSSKKGCFPLSKNIIFDKVTFSCDITNFPYETHPMVIINCALFHVCMWSSFGVVKLKKHSDT